MSEYYGCFIDPCRVAKPKDKGKVERDVQTIRQQFRKFKALNDTVDIYQSNKLIAHWIRNEYGLKEHGTTGERPYHVFLTKEQKKLKPLPLKPFELAEWKAAKVHPDCYIQYNKKAYSIPYRYVGKRVWVKATDKILSVYFHEELIKQHVITDKKRHTDYQDFPENTHIILNEGLPDLLIRKASRVGRNFRQLIYNTLKVHAFLNLRKAQGLLALKDQYMHSQLDRAAEYVIDKQIQITPKSFKHLLKNFENYEEENCGIMISETTKEFVRDGTYYEHSS